MLIPIVVILVLGFGGVVLYRSRGVRTVAARDVLATVLLWWTPRDPFSARDLLNGGIAIIGRTGSGKTSSSGKKIGRAVVAFPKSGGFIPVGKPGDYVMWRNIFNDAGRPDDLMIFEPQGKWRINFFGYLASIGADARTITQFILNINQSLKAANTRGGGEDGQFFDQQNERWIYNAVVVLKIANGKVTAPDLQKFFATAASSPDQLRDAAWQKGFHNQSIKAAFEKPKTKIELNDYHLAVDDWFHFWVEMADRTRTSISAGIMGILHLANTGIIRELVSGETNCSPLDMLRGKFILLNMTPAEYGPAATYIATGLRLLTQMTVLRRQPTPDDYINVIFLDEFQQSVNEFDAHYLALCRSYMGCMICLTQSLHSVYAALRGDSGDHKADALLTNFQTKIFHAVGDEKTAEYASSLIGKSLQTFIGGSMSPEEDIFSTLMGRSHFTGSFSQHYEAILQANLFMNGLRTGGPSGYVCDAIVIRSGERFAHGANWLKVSFSQR